MAHEPYNLLARYQILERALRDPLLTRGDCVVMSIILGHVDSDGEAWPGMKRICERALVSKRTAIRAVENLESHGYLEVERAAGRSNYYRVINPATGDTGDTSALSNLTDYPF